MLQLGQKSTKARVARWSLSLAISKLNYMSELRSAMLAPQNYAEMIGQKIESPIHVGATSGNPGARDDTHLFKSFFLGSHTIHPPPPPFRNCRYQSHIRSCLTNRVPKCQTWNCFWKVTDELSSRPVMPQHHYLSFVWFSLAAFFCPHFRFQ